MTKLYNRTNEKPKRKELRITMPPAEVILWSQLKGKQVDGYKFRRQYSVDKYVIDFYCAEIKLAIEIDGESHFVGDAEARDKERQRMIESAGIGFLRFTNRDVYERLNGVLYKIREFIRALEAKDK